MENKDALFGLIKSLSKSEKRYFNLFSKKSKETNYVKLFDAVNRQQEYDEKELIQVFSKTLPGNNFSVTKHHLYNLVLKSLRSFHSYNGSVNVTLKEYLHDIEILAEKGLYAQCEKTITKAKQLAVKYDLQLPLLELLKWELRMIRNHNYAGATEDEIKQLYDTILEITKQYNTTNEYDFLNDLLFFKLMQEGECRNAEEMLLLQSISKNPLFRADEKNLSYHALYSFYAMHDTYYSSQNDYENAYTYQFKFVHLLEKNPYQIAEHPMQYIVALDNLSVGQILLKKYNECAESIEKLSMLQVKSMVVKKYLNFIIDNMKLSLCLYTGAFEEGLQLLKSIEGRWDKEDSAMVTRGRIIYFQYNAAYICFATGDYSRANNYLSNLMNNETDTGSDIYCFVQILSLLVYFEMGKEDLLEYRVKSVQRFLYKRKRLYKVETIILEFIRKELPKIYSDKELIPAFKNLKMEIEEVIKDPFEQKALDYFDFISWLESKIEGRAFAEVVREKANSH